MNFLITCIKQSHLSGMETCIVVFALLVKCIVFIFYHSSLPYLENGIVSVWCIVKKK